MTPVHFLLQALASYIAIAAFLIVLNVQRKMLVPGGLLGMLVWLIYLLLLEPTNVLIATFFAAIIGSCVSQIMSLWLNTLRHLFIGYTCTTCSRLSSLHDHDLFRFWRPRSSPNQYHYRLNFSLSHSHRYGQRNNIITPL